MMGFGFLVMFALLALPVVIAVVLALVLTRKPGKNK